MHYDGVPPPDAGERSAWLAVVAAAVTEPATARLRYSAGSEFSPGDPWGRLILDLDGGDSAHLERRQRGQSWVWDRRLDEGAFERLLAQLSAAAWPEPQTLLVPDGTLRSLELEHRSQRATLRVEWYAAAKVDGLREAFAQLDAIVAQIAGLNQA